MNQPLTLQRLLEHARAKPEAVFDMSDCEHCLGADLTGATLVTTHSAFYGGECRNTGPNGERELWGPTVVDHHYPVVAFLSRLLHAGVGKKTGAELVSMLEAELAS